MSDLRDMCPDCQRPYSVHSQGGEGEDAYPVCPTDLRDELRHVVAQAFYQDVGVNHLTDAILPIIERETEQARRAWTTEHHRAALQIVTEIERGLTVVDMEVRRARFSDARHTIATLRGLLPPLEQLIQRRPRRSETEPAREWTAPTNGPKET